jgi:serine O-acetyltransferase
LWRKVSEKGSPINRVRLYRLTKKYGLEISSLATIGKGLYLGHPYNITVASGVVIGDNVNLHKGAQ